MATEKRRRESGLHEPQVAAVAAASEPKRQRTQEQPGAADEEEDYGEELPAVDVVVEEVGAGAAEAAEAAVEDSASAIGRVTHTVCVPR